MVDKLWFSIDRGGTFTDVFCQEGSGKQHVLKLLSVDPAYKDAPTEGIRRVLEIVTGKEHPRDRLVDTSSIASIRMGTTVATNALLERKGDRCALITTRGFKDLLHIGNQSRPNIFDLEIKCPGVLYDRVVEVDERVALVQDRSELLGGGEVLKGVTGEKVEVVTPVDLAKLRADLTQCLEDGIKAVAVMLLHSYTFRAHEVAIGDLCKEMGFTQISLSSEVMPMVKAVPRGLTSCADAYLSPSIQRYLTTFKIGFDEGLKKVELLFMQSDGGLAGVDRFNGFQAILSGPAGGVVGYARTTYEECGCKPVIGFDMGGTSTDVSRYAGQYEHVFETTTAGVTIQAPQLDINTVAAGGGSCLQFLSGLFRVGPESSSAFPGPTCYRRGGPLSVTDANLQLGRIIPSRFPHIFGPKEDEPLDSEATTAAFEKMVEQVNAFKASGTEGGTRDGAAKMTCDQVAYGYIQVANEAMCRPIRALTSARGHDIRSHVLSCFGGAGGQHACAIARSLGISTIFVHRYASILSAYGLFLAEVAEEAQEPAASSLDKDQHAMLADRLCVLERQAIEALVVQGYSRDRIETQPFLNLRYEGTDSAVMTPLTSASRAPQPVKVEEIPAFESSFVAGYKREFGFVLTGRRILVDDVRVRAIGRNASGMDAGGAHSAAAGKTAAVPDETVSVYFEGGRQPTGVYALAELQSGCEIRGPAILLDKISTILVEPNCTALITPSGDVKIAVGDCEAVKISTELDLVQLSIFSHRFMSIAEQMGRTLQRTSISTNIKERLDFSCALFDERGGLVANAPHIPVHLGSMQDAVRHQVKLLAGDLHEGDVLMTNHPCAGGTHLPDITIITPVFDKGVPVFFVASRGHHADIGGITPGSMPPHSKNLLEEGMNCESFRLVSKGVWQEEGVRELLASPSQQAGCAGARNVADNLSDLRAQVAANQKGIGLVQELISEFGLAVVQAYMKHIQKNAEVAVRELLKKVAAESPDAAGYKRTSEGETAGAKATLMAEDYMDDGTKIKLKVLVDGSEGTAHFDFTGTGPQVLGNCNAPKAVTYSAIIYCMRCMVARDIPLNQGCLNPCTVVIPEGTILAPGAEAAVVGGNVLTSQRVVDVILKAFGACAASQGCMNNVTFGDESFGYYETIAGGAGAGPSWHGRSGVHTHMTNTRITDVEIMERRYPILVREFGLRRDSGGNGAFKGGDGTIRELLFRRPIQLSLLTERRERAPYGLAGGQEGQKGENLLVKSDGSSVSLGAKNSVLCKAGDALRLLAPGGGGYGVPSGPGGGALRAGSSLATVGHGAAGSLANYEQMQTSA